MYTDPTCKESWSLRIQRRWRVTVALDTWLLKWRINAKRVTVCEISRDLKAASSEVQNNDWRVAWKRTTFVYLLMYFTTKYGIFPSLEKNKSPKTFYGIPNYLFSTESFIRCSLTDGANSGLKQTECLVNIKNILDNHRQSFNSTYTVTGYLHKLLAPYSLIHTKNTYMLFLQQKTRWNLWRQCRR